MPCKNKDLSSVLSTYITLGMVMHTCNLSAANLVSLVISRQQDYLKRRKTMFPRMTPEALLCLHTHIKVRPYTHKYTH